MGYIRHNAIVVTSWNDEAIVAAADKARSLGMAVLGPSDRATNYYCTLLICPDGSKEGWDQSDEGDRRREAFREWTRTLRYEDDSSPLAWCEVAYGSDDREAVVCESEWTASNTHSPTESSD